MARLTIGVSISALKLYHNINSGFASVDLIFKKPKVPLQQGLHSGEQAASSCHEHPQTAPGELHVPSQQPVLLQEVCFNVPLSCRK